MLCNKSITRWNSCLFDLIIFSVRLGTWKKLVGGFEWLSVKPLTSHWSIRAQTGRESDLHFNGFCQEHFFYVCANGGRKGLLHFQVRPPGAITVVLKKEEKKTSKKCSVEICYLQSHYSVEYNVHNYQWYGKNLHFHYCFWIISKSWSSAFAGIFIDWRELHQS